MPPHSPPDRAGRVSLIGAGPGDPELLTMRALRVLQQADVVLFDRLVGPGVLDLAPAHARRIDVGKRCGRHAMSQAAINRLILDHVRGGAHVVRLKGGDPSIFGRGGEEIECLEQAGIGVEVVPGITTACAVAASLRVPLTHRNVAHRLHFVTGHGRQGPGSAEDWAALAAGGGTLAVYMGVRAMPGLVAQLLASGLPPGTPAVAVENATLPAERRIDARVADLPEAVAGLEGPTLVLIGTVLERRAIAIGEVRKIA